MRPWNMKHAWHWIFNPNIIYRLQPRSKLHCPRVRTAFALRPASLLPLPLHSSVRVLQKPNTWNTATSLYKSQLQCTGILYMTPLVNLVLMDIFGLHYCDLIIRSGSENKEEGSSWERYFRVAYCSRGYYLSRRSLRFWWSSTELVGMFVPWLQEMCAMDGGGGC